MKVIRAVYDGNIGKEIALIEYHHTLPCNDCIYGTLRDSDGMCLCSNRSRLYGCTSRRVWKHASLFIYKLYKLYKTRYVPDENKGIIF